MSESEREKKITQLKDLHERKIYNKRILNYLLTSHIKKSKHSIQNSCIPISSKKNFKIIKENV